MVFNALPCNDILIKVLWSTLILVSTIIIYYTVRLEHKEDAWRTTPLIFVFLPFLLNSLKIENDPLSYPFVFASFYFFFKYWKHNDKRDMIYSLILLGVGGLFWFGIIYALLLYSLFVPALLILTIPIVLIFFNQIVGPITPSLETSMNVDENNPFKFVRNITVPAALFLLSGNLWAVRKKLWLLALPFILLGIIAPKFLTFLTPLIPILLIHAYKKAIGLGKSFFMPLAFVLSVVLILQVGIGWHGPTEAEHSLVQEAIMIAHDKEVILQNDWGLGHLVFFYGGFTTKHSGRSPIDCTDCIVLSYNEFPGCSLLKEQDSLKIYDC